MAVTSCDADPFTVLVHETHVQHVVYTHEPQLVNDQYFDVPAHG